MKTLSLSALTLGALGAGFLDTFPTEARAAIAVATVGGITAAGRALWSFGTNRMGKWLDGVDAAVASIPQIAASQAQLVRAQDGMRETQYEMREYLCERIDQTEGTVMSRIDLLEAKTTGEDRVLAGRIAAMENTVEGMESRLNGHSARIRLSEETAPAPRAHASTRPIPPRRKGNES